jgi:hypothetical protein
MIRWGSTEQENIKTGEQDGKNADENTNNAPGKP